MKKSLLHCHFAKALIATLLFFSQAVLAGVIVEEVRNDDGDNLTIFHMTVTPAAEPVPALKHRLWLRPQDLRPGNSVVHYLRVFPEGGFEKTFEATAKEFGEAFDGWYSNEVAIKDLPLDKVRIASARFDNYVEQMIRPGTMCRDCDWGWQALNLMGPETISFLLPDVQAMRTVARGIALRTRLAIAEGRYDDAIEGLRMNYRMGRDVSEQVFLISDLVGVAIGWIATNNAIDLIAAPGSPNLYWALAEVPAPLADFRDSIRVEMGLGLRFFPVLLEAETAEHSPMEWARLFRDSLKDFGDLDPRDFFGQLPGLAAMGLSIVAYPEAKQRLIASGMAAEDVEAMSVGQVIAIDTAREYRRIADEQEKWWYVSFEDARKNSPAAEAAIFEGSTFNFGRTIAAFLLPAIQAARYAEVRQDWQKNALLTLEALRMHAAENGAFPKSLDEIQVVPVPDNPITHKPYVYRLDDGVAVLELPFSDGMPGVAWRFEMKLTEQE